MFCFPICSSEGIFLIRLLNYIYIYIYIASVALYFSSNYSAIKAYDEILHSHLAPSF